MVIYIAVGPCPPPAPGLDLALLQSWEELGSGARVPAPFFFLFLFLHCLVRFRAVLDAVRVWPSPSRDAGVWADGCCAGGGGDTWGLAV